MGESFMEVVRKLDLNDLEQMISLRIAIQDFTLAFMNKEGVILKKEELIEETKKYLEKHLNNNMHMFGVFVDDELIANCGFYIDEHFPTYCNREGLVGYICNVFTKEEYRGKGYQKKVFDVCLKFAKEMGIIEFKLYSRNENAISMYKSFGFTNCNNTFNLVIK